MNTQHAITRLAERMTAEEAETVAQALDALARQIPDNRGYAVMIGRWEAPRGEFRIDPDGTGPSNGTDLYAVIRRRSVVTVMWRRQAQPVTPEAFRVDVVGHARLPAR